MVAFWADRNDSTMIFLSEEVSSAAGAKLAAMDPVEALANAIGPRIPRNRKKTQSAFPAVDGGSERAS